MKYLHQDYIDIDYNFTKVNIKKISTYTLIYIYKNCF